MAEDGLPAPLSRNLSVDCLSPRYLRRWVQSSNHFNVRATCNELQKVPEALSVDSGQPDAIRHCVEHEQQARDHLSRQWNKFTPADRNRCLGESQSGTVAPAYSELESCLQMTRDSRQLNSEQTGDNSEQHRSQVAPPRTSNPEWTQARRGNCRLVTFYTSETDSSDFRGLCFLAPLTFLYFLH